MANRDLPAPQGLYDPRFEHDSCGVSFLVDMKGRQSHSIVEQAVAALCNLNHRGASGCEVNTGDGAGILLQVPDRFFRAVVDFELPAPGAYATGIGFLPAVDPDRAAKVVEELLREEGLDILGWREVPHDPSMVGASALEVMPAFRQVFVGRDGCEGIDLERLVFMARKRVEHEAPEALGGERVYFPSLSTRTFAYKGMLTTLQLRDGRAARRSSASGHRESRRKETSGGVDGRARPGPPGRGPPRRPGGRGSRATLRRTASPRSRREASPRRVASPARPATVRPGGVPRPRGGAGGSCLRRRRGARRSRRQSSTHRRSSGDDLGVSLAPKS